MKVKIFTGANPEDIEKSINRWFSETPWVKVKQITQSTGDLLAISIWYEEPDVPILG